MLKKSDLPFGSEFSPSNPLRSQRKNLPQPLLPGYNKACCGSVSAPVQKSP